MTWTDERVDLLKKLWPEPLSGAKIADRIGGVTRAAVISKAHRIGLPPKPKRERSPKAKQKNTAPAKPKRSSSQAKASSADRHHAGSGPPTEPTPHVEAPEELVIPLAERICHDDLEPHNCRWPIGEPAHADFRFCGRKRVSDPRIPYCEHHARMAFQPQQTVRKRSRAVA